MESEPVLGGIGVSEDAPRVVEELTPEWLTAHLRGIRVISAANVVSIAVTAVGEFGTSGDLRRLSLSYDHQEAGAPASLVAKFATRDAEARAVIHAMGAYEREAHFYAELAPQSPVRVPRCYLASVDPRSGASLLLLEDLSSLPAWGWQPRVTVPEAEVVLREVASLHAAWWSNDRLRELPWLALRGITATDQVGQVFRRYWPAFLDKLSIPVTEEISDLGRYGERYLPRVWAYLFGSPPITLVHNDVQGANILFDGVRNSAILLDWQQTTIGRGAVDVAYFLCGSLPQDDRRNAWNRLVRMYHELLLQGGVVDYPLERCEIDCRLALLPAAARVAIAVGIHPAFRTDPGGFWNEVYPRYAAALNDLQVADLCADQFG